MPHFAVGDGIVPDETGLRQLTIKVLGIDTLKDVRETIMTAAYWGLEKKPSRFQREGTFGKFFAGRKLIYVLTMRGLFSKPSGARERLENRARGMNKRLVECEMDAVLLFPVTVQVRDVVKPDVQPSFLMRRGPFSTAFAGPGPLKSELNATR